MPVNTRAVELLAKCAGDPAEAPSLFQALDEETPFGLTLVGALSCTNFPSAGLENLMSWMVNGSPERKSDAEMLMATVASAIISEASFTIGRLGVADGAPAPPTSVEPRDMTVVLTNLAKSKTAAELLVRGPFFLPELDVDKGNQLALTTVLGAHLASRNPFGFNAMHQTTLLRLLQLFPTDAKGRVGAEHAEAHRESEAQLRRAVMDGARAFKTVVDAFLRAGPIVRDATLTFLSRALALAEVHRKSMQKPDEDMHEVTAAMLCHACLALALPVFTTRSSTTANAWFPRQVPAEYWMTPESGKTLCAFSAAEERIISGERAIPPPVDVKAATADYPPKMHLYAVGVRALACFISPFHHKWHRHYQQLHYPGLSARDRKVIQALDCMYLALITDADVIPDYVALADATAEWLIHVLAVQSDGSVPRPAPNAAAADNDEDDDAARASPAASSADVPRSFALWANLPLTMLDDIFSLSKLFGGFDQQHPPPNVGFFEIRHLAALMLVLMGDTQLFPKPHTHAMFPRFLELLTEPRLPLRNDFMNHEWFAAHVMRACVECYIAVQPCDQDRQAARYHLAGALKDLLRDASLANSVRPKYNDENDDTLESLSSMVTAEATGALDHCFEALQKMREIELANDRQPPAVGHEKFDEYQQQGSTLSYEVQRAMAAINLFDALTQHFSQGMAKRLVVQQISGALMAFLVRLAGPSMSELKISDPSKYGFKPREMLGSIVHNFVKFANSENFRRYCVQSQTTLEPFDAAVSVIVDRQLVASDDAESLSRMAKQLHATADVLKYEDEVMEDAPDWARCSLMFAPLSDPVALPTTSDDLTFVEKETIRHNLLSEKRHPFTREPLSMAKVLEFNARPDVAAKVKDLKRRVDAWIAEATKNKQQASSA